MGRPARLVHRLRGSAFGTLLDIIFYIFVITKPPIRIQKMKIFNVVPQDGTRLGVSYLAISQYFAAVEGSAKEGSALKCMVPWEGLTDMYRDVACPGGVNGTGFLNFWWNTEVKEALNQSVAEFIANEGGIPPELISKHPLMDQYWADKAVELERIDIPMLICGSFSDHELHTRGSHRAFSRVSSEKKWLYTHRGGKWSEFYSLSVQELVRDFMDHFLKGQSNRFESLPPVRLEIRSSREEVRDVRWLVLQTRFPFGSNYRVP